MSLFEREIELNDFIFKWRVLIKSLALNFLRNLAIVKNRSKGASSEAYKSINVLDDSFLSELPNTNESQINFIRNNGRKRYLLDTLYFDHIIKNSEYENIIEFGCGVDELGSVLAVNNPTRQFSLYDLIPGTNMLNDKYKISNLKFFEENTNQI